MPDEQAEIGDLDFAGEMHAIAYEAQAKAAPPAPRLDRKELMLALGQMFRPLALELENIKRATSENSVLLTILGKAAAKTPAASPGATTAPAGPPHAQGTPEPPDSLDRISRQLQQLGAVETANQKLFDALHGELKGYKDNFLFDALQRPFIRDLVSLFDDFSGVHAQVFKRLDALDSAPKNGQPALAIRPGKPANGVDSDPAKQTEIDFLRALAENLDNQIHHLREVFLRMEVVLSESAPGTALDKKTHRTVAFEPARRAGEEAQVVRSLKPGFAWRERMIRPEEVVVSRWTGEPPPASPATPTSSQEKKNPLDLKVPRLGGKPLGPLRGKD